MVWNRVWPWCVHLETMEAGIGTYQTNVTVSNLHKIVIDFSESFIFTLVKIFKNNWFLLSIPLELCPHINTTTLNTEILQHDNTPGGSVLYACSPGYRHVSGDLIQRCLKDGSWSGTPPLCEGKYCLTVCLSDLPILKLFYKALLV